MLLLACPYIETVALYWGPRLALRDVVTLSSGAGTMLSTKLLKKEVILATNFICIYILFT